MRPNSKIAYLVIEIYKREIVALSALKDVLIKDGVFDYVIIIELRLFLKLAQWKLLPVGVVLMKSLPDYIEKTAERLHRSGFKLVIQNQESIAVLPSEVQAGLQVGISAEKYASKLLAGNDAEYRDLTSVFGDAKVKNRGFLRFLVGKDRYRNIYKEAIDDIQHRYGDDFVFFPTTFGNVLSGLTWGQILSGKPDLADQHKSLATGVAEMQMAEEFDHWKTSQLYTFFELCNLVRLLEGTGKKLIIRPHPSEPFDVIKFLFSHAKHVEVSNAYSTIPWLFCARHTIVSTSTVAAEANLIGVEPLILLPEIGKRGRFLDDVLVNKLGKKFRTAIELFTFIQQPTQTGQQKESAGDQKPDQSDDRGMKNFAFELENTAITAKHSPLFLLKVVFSVVEMIFKISVILRPRSEAYYLGKFHRIAVADLGEDHSSISHVASRFAVFSKPQRQSKI